jgi:hypothetical protein
MTLTRTKFHEIVRRRRLPESTVAAARRVMSAAGPPRADEADADISGMS